MPASTYRQLSATDLPDVETHLLELSTDCRKLRFGNLVNDHFIRAHVAQIKEPVCRLIGGYMGSSLKGLAEIRPFGGAQGVSAELAFSVERNQRGNGLGAGLMTHALAHMHMHGMVEAHLVCDAGNRRMRVLLERFGARQDVQGRECFARIDLRMTDLAKAA